MGEYTIEVQLTGPAKVNGRFRKAGEVVTVTDTVFGQLLDVKAIDENVVAAAVAGEANRRFGADLLTGEDFDQAVAAAVADREADWSKAFDHFETMADDRVNAATTALEAKHLTDLQSVKSKLPQSDTELSETRQRIQALETELAAAKVAADAVKADSGAGSKTKPKD